MMFRTGLLYLAPGRVFFSALAPPPSARADPPHPPPPPPALALVCVYFPSTAALPAPGVGSGFDKLGHVLPLPPLLIEKYLAAPEKIVAMARAHPETWKRIVLELPSTEKGTVPLRIEGQSP